MQRFRWADADIGAVELFALGVGLAIAGLLGLLGRWGAAGAFLGGVLILLRAVLAIRHRPWWRPPPFGPKRDRSENDGA